MSNSINCKYINVFKVVFIAFLFAIGGINNFVYAQTFQWAKAMGGGTSDEGKSIAVDASGNVYTTGSFNGSADFDPGADTFTLTSVGLKDVFISKLDPSGNFVWAKSFGGPTFDVGYGIAVDGSGNIYTTGYFQGTADFDPGAGTFTLTSSGYGNFISKLDASGNFVWAKTMGQINSYAIALDASGAVYTTGVFAGTVDFDPNAGTFNLVSAWGNDVFVSKLDASGNFILAKAITNGSNSSSSLGTSIADDANGNIYTTGKFRETTDFDPGAGTFNLISTLGDDIFVSKLDVSGNLLWAKAMGSSGSSIDIGQSIAVDAAGNVFTTGFFSNTADFDPGAGAYTLTSNGQRDVFVSKLDPSGNFIWAKTFGGATDDVAHDIAVTADGDVFTTGSFNHIADFDPSAATHSITSAGGDDIFVSSLDASGNFVSALTMGGTNQEVGYSIALGSIFVTGSFYGTVDFDPSTVTSNLRASGSDIFITKLGADVGAVEEKNHTDNIRFYPNPSTGIFTCISSSTFSEITIFNIVGKVVFAEKINSGTIEVNMTDKSKGVYFYHLKDNKQTITGKIIIE